MNLIKGLLQWSQSTILTNIDKLLFGIPDPSAFIDSTKWIASFPPLSLQFTDKWKTLEA